MKNSSWKHPFPTFSDKMFDGNRDGKLGVLETAFRDAHIEEMSRNAAKQDTRPKSGYIIPEYPDEKEADESYEPETSEARQYETISGLQKQIESSSKAIRDGVIGLCISLPLAILSFVLSSHGDLGVSIVITSFAAFCSLVFIVSGINEKRRATGDLEAAIHNLNKLKKNLHARIEEMVAQDQEYAAKGAAKHPKCPICKSTDTERISAHNSTDSAAAGLAFSKNGKQYKCNNCKHKW